MRKVVLVALGLIVVVGCAPEPTWEGKTVSVWRKELKSKDYMARFRAASALGFVKPTPPEVIPDLIEALHDPHERVRLQAAAALGRIGPAAHDALPTLRDLRNDPEQMVRDAADTALQQIAPAGQ